MYYYRHLLEEYQTEKTKWQEEKTNMSCQLVKLLEENEKQQELLSTEFDKNPQCDAILQSDMNKLNYENLVRKVLIFFLINVKIYVNYIYVEIYGGIIFISSTCNLLTIST